MSMLTRVSAALSLACLIGLTATVTAAKKPLSEKPPIFVLQWNLPCCDTSDDRSLYSMIVDNYIPAGIAAGGHGRVFVNHWVMGWCFNCEPSIHAGMLAPFTAQGDSLGRWLYWAGGWDLRNFARDLGVAADDSGYVYLVWPKAFQGERAMKMTADGRVVRGFSAPDTGMTPFFQPTNVSLAPGGQVFVLSTITAPWLLPAMAARVDRFNAAGEYLGGWTLGQGSGPGQVGGPFWQLTEAMGMAVGSTGHVYLGDPMNCRVQEFDSAGTFVRSWGTCGSGAGQLGAPVGAQGLTGLAVDEDGDIYVADRSNDRIEKFTAEGDFLTEWGSSGSGPGQFSRPNGVAVDPDGFVYVLDWGNQRVQKFARHRGWVRREPELTDGRMLRLSAGPNPFSAATTIRFEVRTAGRVDLEVFDLQGRHVKQLETGRTAAGPFSVEWDRTDDGGRRVPSGIYFMRLAVGQEVQTLRLVVLP